MTRPAERPDAGPVARSVGPAGTIEHFEVPILPLPRALPFHQHEPVRPRDAERLGVHACVIDERPLAVAVAHDDGRERAVRERERLRIRHEEVHVTAREPGQLDRRLGGLEVDDRQAEFVGRLDVAGAPDARDAAIDADRVAGAGREDERPPPDAAADFECRTDATAVADRLVEASVARRHRFRGPGRVEGEEVGIACDDLVEGHEIGAFPRVREQETRESRVRNRQPAVDVAVRREVGLDIHGEDRGTGEHGIGRAAGAAHEVALGEFALDAGVISFDAHRVEIEADVATEGTRAEAGRAGESGEGLEPHATIVNRTPAVRHARVGVTHVARVGASAFPRPFGSGYGAPMRVEFHGAARTVTGSSTLLEAGGTRILVDCGQFQGGEDLERLNRDRLGFDPKTLDALVLTHGHIDHIGRTPRLVAEGFRGPVICTNATADIATQMLKDSAKIAEEDAKFHGGPPPLFNEQDIVRLGNMMQPLRYGETRALGKGISVRLTDAGHILGSAHVLATMTEEGRSVAFGISGDVGSPGRPIVADPTPFGPLDYLQCESTYGDRDHKSVEASIEEFNRIVIEADACKGVVVVPAFSLGRTQDILYYINALKNAGALPHLEVIVDSPLATRLTTVFRRNPEAMDDDTKGMLKRGDDPFDFPGLRIVTDPRESDRVSREATCALIISASGMCQNGRIVKHLTSFLPKSSTQVVIVGYQAPGTTGRRLVDGATMVRIRGREVPVAAKITTIGGFSAHAGQHEMLDWIEAGGRPKKVFLVHGEPDALETFAKAIKDRLGLPTQIPRRGDGVVL